MNNIPLVHSNPQPSGCATLNLFLSIHISPTPSSVRHRSHTRILTLCTHRTCVISNIVLPFPDLTLILYHHATAAVKALHEIGGTIAREVVGVTNTGTRQEREKTYRRILVSQSKQPGNRDVQCKPQNTVPVKSKHRGFIFLNPSKSVGS